MDNMLMKTITDTESTTSCPDCPEYQLEMYEHYDEYDNTILRQDQHFECPNCHRTFARTAWYKLEEAYWLPDEEE